MAGLAGAFGVGGKAGRYVPALLLVLASCSTSSGTTPASAVKLGIDRAGMKTSVAPGDDFFEYVNGGWVERTEIPADRSRWGAFDVLTEEATRRTREILEDASSQSTPSEKKARDFYAALMDESAIESKKLDPLRLALDRIAAVNDRRALSRALGEELRADVDPLNWADFHTDRLFGLWASVDLNDPSRNGAYLLQGGLDMPDREYYVSDAPRMAQMRDAFKTHVATMMKLAGVANPEAAASAVTALEAKMAAGHATRLESLNVQTANNPWKTSEFASKAPGLDWDAFFQSSGLDRQTTIVVWHPRAVSQLSALVASQPLAAWKQWLTFHTIDRHAGALPAAFVEARFDFHGRTLTGTPQLAERWKRSVDATNAALGEAVGQMYVARYFSPEAKQHVEALVRNLIGAFGDRLDRLDWMSEQTRTKAREKLGTLVIGVGYPDKWTDYSALEIVRGDAIGNANRAELFTYRNSLAKLGTPVDRREWAMTPQTVNALNLPLQNALNFPAAILAPPFFDPNVAPAVNYGGIGAVIGHEISHSFDDQGAQFDAQGRLANWWTKDDFAHFEASGQKLAAQYDRYQPLPDAHVNGKLTLSENIADLAGLATTYDAWQRSLGGSPAPSVDGVSGVEQFFLSYAQIWRAKIREPALRQRLVSDGHAPQRYRTATVRNLDAWYAPFNVKPGQALHLAPADRVRVW